MLLYCIFQRALSAILEKAGEQFEKGNRSPAFGFRRPWCTTLGGEKSRIPRCNVEYLAGRMKRLGGPHLPTAVLTQ